MERTQIGMKTLFLGIFAAFFPVVLISCASASFGYDDVHDPPDASGVSADASRPTVESPYVTPECPEVGLDPCDCVEAQKRTGGRDDATEECIAYRVTSAFGCVKHVSVKCEGFHTVHVRCKD